MGLPVQSRCDRMGRHHDLHLTHQLGLFQGEKQSYRRREAGELESHGHEQDAHHCSRGRTCVDLGLVSVTDLDTN